MRGARDRLIVDRRSALLLLGGGLLAGCSSPLGTPKDVAVPGSGISGSRTLRDFVGVNTHWDYPDTPYAFAYARVRKALIGSGIRHVRSAVLTRTADLARAGIRTTLVVDQDANGDGDPARIVRNAAKLASEGAIGAFEAPNEPDLSWRGGQRSYGGQQFPRAALAWQQDLFRAVNGSPATRGVPVIGLSLGRTYWTGGHPFGAGELAGSCDWGNVHSWAAGNPLAEQDRYAEIDDYYRNADFPSVTLDASPINLTTYRPAFGDRPLAATETGYSTWRLGQSEVVQGWYTVRTVLEFLRLGIPRTYLYELVDQFADPDGSDDQAHYGLLRHDLTPKPAFVALRTLLKVAGDAVPRSDAALARAGLSYRVVARPPSGYDAAQVHQVAFLRRDGRVVIALWHEVSADDLAPVRSDPPAPPRLVGHPDVPVTLSIDQPARAAAAAAYLIGDSGHAQAVELGRSGSDLTFPVSGRVTLVVL
jgi:hypothetical protein